MAASTGHATLDLTATVEDFEGAGIMYKRLVFRDELRRIEMELPAGWSFQSSPTCLSLKSLQVPFAGAVIRTESALPFSALTETVMKELEEQTLRTAPPASQGVKVVATKPNPGGPGGGESFEVVISYQAMGYTFLRSTTFVSLPDSRLVLELTAPQPDFQNLGIAFRRAVQSWAAR